MRFGRSGRHRPPTSDRRNDTGLDDVSSSSAWSPSRRRDRRLSAHLGTIAENRPADVVVMERRFQDPSMNVVVEGDPSWIELVTIADDLAYGAPRVNRRACRRSPQLEQGSGEADAHRHELPRELNGCRNTAST